jgi:CBS domain-containing protein
LKWHFTNKLPKFIINRMTPSENSETQSKRRASAGARLRCRDIMTSNVVAAAPETTLQEIARLMSEGDMGALPVVDASNRLVGIVTDRDIVVRAVSKGADVQITTVGDVMTTEIFTALPDDFVFQAIRLMGDKQVRRVPVISENGTLEGILAMADIALEMEDEREIAEALEEISSGAAFWRKG